MTYEEAIKKESVAEDNCLLICTPDVYWKHIRNLRDFHIQTNGIGYLEFEGVKINIKLKQ